MNQPNRQEIEKRLQPEPVEPPDGLAERIKAEIPVRSRVVSWPSRPAATGSTGARRWAIAATIAVAVIGTGLTYRLTSRVAPPAIDQPAMEQPAGEQPVTQQPALARPADELPAASQAVRPALPAEDAERIPTSGGEALELRTGERDVGVQSMPSPPQAFETDDPFDRPVAEAPAVVLRDSVARQPRAPASRRPRASRVQGLQAEKKLESPPIREYLAMADGRVADVYAEPSQSPARSVAPPSTGGTTEPNDQPYGDMFFRSWGVNPFIDTEDDNLSTFGLDVDTGSYTLARSYIERGHLPPPEAVRVEEFINYFDYGDAAPRRGDFAIHAESAPSPFASGPRYQLLRFGLRGREIGVADRLPATLIFVVDVSGSMDRENRLGLVKRSLSLLLDQLRPRDRVGLVVYGSAGRVLLEPTGDLEAIRSAIGRLRAEGSTNAEEGLVLGYELAERYRRRGELNRVVLCSDGVANVGRTGPESILARVEAATERGIELTAVGFGMGNYNDLLLEQLADNGDGSYAYVDTLDEARRVFVENLTGTLQTIAAEAKAQVEFNPEVVARYRLLGYENRDIADERFRDDSVDAGEIGAGHSVTALYEIKLQEEVRRDAVLATLHLRWESKAEGEILEVAESIRVRDVARSWDEASAALQLTSLVAEFAEILRDSYWAKDGNLQDVFARTQRVSAEFAGDVEVASFASLVGRAARLEAGASAE